MKSFVALCVLLVGFTDAAAVDPCSPRMVRMFSGMVLMHPTSPDWSSYTIGDLKVDMDVVNSIACCRMCQETPSCRYWTFVATPHSELGKCGLNKEMGNKVRNKDATYGLIQRSATPTPRPTTATIVNGKITADDPCSPSRFVPKIALMHQSAIVTDINVAFTSPDAMFCCRQCQQNPLCRYWTFILVPDQVCGLSAKMGDQVNNKSAYSGVVRRSDDKGVSTGVSGGDSK